MTSSRRCISSGPGKSLSGVSERQLAQREQHAGGRAPDAVLAEMQVTHREVDASQPPRAGALVARVEQRGQRQHEAALHFGVIGAGAKVGASRATTGVMRKPVSTIWSGR